MLTKRQLFLDKVDRKAHAKDFIPASFWFHFLEDEASQDYFDDPSVFEKNIAGHRKYVNAAKPDFIKLMSDGFFQFPSSNLKHARSIDDVDMDQLEVLESNHPWIQKQVELVQAQIKENPEEVANFYNIFAPATYYKFLYVDNDLNKDTRLANDIERDQAKVKQVLEIIGQSVAHLAEQVVNQGGADGIYLSLQNVQDKRIDDSTYQEVIQPSDKIVVDKAHEISPYHILHICGYRGATNNLALYDYVDFPIVNWAVNVEDVGLEAGEQIYKNKMILGGFDNTGQGVLYQGNRDQINRATRKILESVSHENLMIGADCTVPMDINLDHIHWVKEEIVNQHKGV